MEIVRFIYIRDKFLGTLVRSKYGSITGSQIVINEYLLNSLPQAYQNAEYVRYFWRSRFSFARLILNSCKILFPFITWNENLFRIFYEYVVI